MRVAMLKQATRAALAVAALLVAAGFTACAGTEDPTTLELSGAVSVCNALHTSCQLLAASGADYRVFGDGEVVAEGVLDEHGRTDLAVEPGDYSAAIALPDLDLGALAYEPSLVTVAVVEGGSANLDLVLEGATLTPGRGSGP